MFGWWFQILQSTVTQLCCFWACMSSHSPRADREADRAKRRTSQQLGSAARRAHS